MSITPIQHQLSLNFGADSVEEYPFSLTDAQIKRIVEMALQAPDFLKIAADFWSNLLGGKSVEDFLKDFLAKLKVSCCPIFQVTGDCASFDDIDIDWTDPDISPASVPGVTVEAKPNALKMIVEKCACKGDDPKNPQGRRKVRVFYIKWWVTISIKGVTIPFQAQVDRIRVEAPCCCADGSCQLFPRNVSEGSDSTLQVKPKPKRR